MRVRQRPRAPRRGAWWVYRDVSGFVGVYRGVSGCVVDAWGVFMARRRCVALVMFAVGGMCVLGLRVGMCCFGSPTAVYSRVVRISLVVMDVVWFCTARVCIVVNVF